MIYIETECVRDLIFDDEVKFEKRIDREERRRNKNKETNITINLS